MEEMRVRRGDAYRRMREKKKKRTRLILAAVALALVVLVIVLIVRGASGSESAVAEDGAGYTPAQVDSRVIDSAERTSFSMQVGDLCVLSLPSGVDVRDVTFTSDNSAVARVDSGGRVDAIGTGKAQITAISPTFSAVCECTVTPADPVQSEPEELLTTAYTANADAVEQNLQTIDIGEYLYSITVNRRTNTVTVYTYDRDGAYTVPVRAMVCSCGRTGGYETPVGEYDIYYRDDWLSLSGDVYGYYISGFYGDFLFHSVPYYTLSHGDLKTEEFNKLGENASEGCVRLMISDVKWIYDNCVVGTPVRVIDEDASADPLGKPPTVKLDGSVKWDPTDPEPGNPYAGGKPAITGAIDTTIGKGDSFDPMSGVKVTDGCGGDISARTVIAGVVIAEKPGEYYLTYTVTDSFRQTCEVTRKITVE